MIDEREYPFFWFPYLFEEVGELYLYIPLIGLIAAFDDFVWFILYFVNADDAPIILVDDVFLLINSGTFRKVLHFFFSF